MKMESQIYLKLVDAVTKYFGKMLSYRQMITSQKWLRHHLISDQISQISLVDTSSS